MNFKEFFPVWDQLTETQQKRISSGAIHRFAEKGKIIHNGGSNCTGLLLTEHGQLRAFILSDDGREITIYRLFDRDICLFSASCMMHSIQFDVTVQAETDTSFWVIPAMFILDSFSFRTPRGSMTPNIFSTRDLLIFCFFGLRRAVSPF